jgi:aspartate aminotransferase
MLPRPYYCLYLLSAALVDLNVKFYDIDPFTGRLDFQSFVKNYSPTDTCAVIINSPGNPLGNVLQEQEIRAIYEYVNAQSFVVLDEIYNNTCFYENYLSPFSYLDPQLLKTTIITNGFSKAFRMYTKRVGFALLPPSLQMPMRIIQQHTLLTHDPVTQLAMEEALKDRDSPRELTAIYKERAQYAFETLNGTACAPIEPHGGFYIVLDCDNWNRNQNFSTSKELARDILERTSVAVVPGTDFGIPQCLRLSFCNDRFNEAIDRLRDYFSC